MRTWLDVEKVFQSARIVYQQRGWLFLCEIDGAEFYYSPQKQKWRLKETKAWQFTDSAQSFITEARKHLQAKKQTVKEEGDSQKSQKQTRSDRTKSSSKRNTRKTKKQKKTKKTSSAKNNHQTQRDKEQTADTIRPEFLELFNEKFQLGIERGYKTAWIWHSLIDNYVLTPVEICWLCTVFDYKPGWAYHNIKHEYPDITYQEVLAAIAFYRNDWLDYFNRRWDFSAYEPTPKSDRDKWQENWSRQKYHQSSTQSTQSNRATAYQVYLDILQIGYPFSKQELKSAYRKQALIAHPDTGGTPESFRKVHNAFEVLCDLAS